MTDAYNYNAYVQQQQQVAAMGYSYPQQQQAPPQQPQQPQQQQPQQQHYQYPQQYQYPQYQ